MRRLSSYLNYHIHQNSRGEKLSWFSRFLLNRESFPVENFTRLGIKTHGSESRGQEEAGRTRRTSELFTRSTALKFVNALNKPPLKLSLSYQGFSKF